MPPKTGFLESFLEHSHINAIFRDNTPEDMLILGIEICLLCLGVHLLGVYLQRKVEHFAARNCRFLAPDEKKETEDGLPDDSTCMNLDLFTCVFKRFKLLLYLCVLYWGESMLTLPRSYATLISLLFSVAGVLLATQFVASLVPFVFDLYMRRHGSTLTTSHSRAVLPIVQGLIWALGFTFLLDNLGFQVSTIIAGLGIVGVAVGLAGQAILSDFFSYLVILFDKPFRIGDFVEVGEGKAGQVEYMGLKTTHLRSLTDDIIVCANSEMTKGVITNFGPIKERQVLAEIGVSYDTPLATLKAMPKILQELVESFPQCIFNRACLLQFGDSNLNYQLMYFVREQRGGIRAFMNTRSDVNIKILERFSDLGIEIAYPTRQIYVTDNPLPDAAPSSPAAAPASGDADPKAARANEGNSASGPSPQGAKSAPPAQNASSGAASSSDPSSPSGTGLAAKKEQVMNALGPAVLQPQPQALSNAPSASADATPERDAPTDTPPRNEGDHGTRRFPSLVASLMQFFGRGKGKR